MAVDGKVLNGKLVTCTFIDCDLMFAELVLETECGKTAGIQFQNNFKVIC